MTSYSQSSSPLVALTTLRALSRLLLRRFNSVLSSSSSSNRTHLLWVAGGGAVAAVGILYTLRAAMMGARSEYEQERQKRQLHKQQQQQEQREGSGSHPRCDDEIEFVDPTEGRFAAYMLQTQRSYEVPLLAAVRRLEKLRAEYHHMLACAEVVPLDTMTDNVDKAVCHTSSGTRDCDSRSSTHAGSDGMACTTGTNSECGVSCCATVHEANDACVQSARDAAVSRLRQAQLSADELLTQYICKLDAAPVGTRADLRERRRALVKDAHALGQRIITDERIPAA